ncbi:MAG: type II toxin-antitoxin system HicA family toxin [Chlamydiae bacterium]|nr:type II toxin-antitoxin system HicA family toxin [Chlamydiota bacterium]
MKKRDLEKELRRLGWWMKRQGGNHEIWTNGEDAEPIPRHREIKEHLAKKIIEVAKNNPPPKEVVGSKK